MSIMTFGSNDVNVQKCDLMHVGTELMVGGARVLSLYAVPIVYEPFNCQSVTLCQLSYPHLAELPLADTSDDQKRLDVSILIGSEQYWNFITGEIRRGQGSPIVISSEFCRDLLGLQGPVGFTTPDIPCSTLTMHSLHIDAMPLEDAWMLYD